LGSILTRRCTLTEIREFVLSFTERENIRVVVFDIRNVLIFYDENRVVRELKKYSLESEEKILQELFRSNAYQSWLMDEISEEEFFEIIKERLGLNMRLEEFFRIYETVFTEPNLPLVSLIKELKIRGIKIALMSDIDYFLYFRLTKRFPFITEEVDYSVFSWDIGTLKPDFVFSVMIRKFFNVEPERILLLDSNPKNIMVWRYRRWHTFHVIDGKEVSLL